MIRDPVIEEVRAVRDAYAKEHGYDIRTIVEALRREQAENGRQVVSLKPKRLVVEPPSVQAYQRPEGA